MRGEGHEFVQNYHQSRLGAENERPSYSNVFLFFANKCLKELPVAAEINASSIIAFLDEGRSQKWAKSQIK